jgi:hypothetical protein
MALHLTRTFTNSSDPHFPVPALEWKVLCHTKATKHLHATVDNAPTRFGGHQFGHGRLFPKGLTAIRFTRRFKRNP